jgi:hypothetical protein
MKHIGVFINVNTIIDLRFTEVKMVSDDGYFAEITCQGNFITTVCYEEPIKISVSWDMNIDQMNTNKLYRLSDVNNSISEEHINQAAIFLADNSRFSIHYYIIDPEKGQKMSKEIYFFMDNQKFHKQTDNDKSTGLKITVSGENSK